MVRTPIVSAEGNLGAAESQKSPAPQPQAVARQTQPPLKQSHPWSVLIVAIFAFITMLTIARFLKTNKSAPGSAKVRKRLAPAPELTRVGEPDRPPPSRPSSLIADRVNEWPIGIDRQPRPDTTIPLKWDRTLLAQMEWRRFELLCERLWTLRGWPTRATAYGADGGVDLLIDSTNSTSGLDAIGQCKCYGSKPVGIEPVRALWGCRDDHSVSKAVFFALSGFTDACHAFAKNKNYQLISGEQLLEMIKALPEQVQADLLAEITQGDFRTPTCATCGIKMIARKSKIKGEQFFGCANFPRCRNTLTISKH